MPASKGILLINLGTPDNTSVGAVRRYLREFLSDPRVIDIPRAFRWILVYLFILPFRPQAAAKAYKKIWEKRGSPLKFHTEDLRDKLQRRFKSEYTVSMAMRYQSPSIRSQLQAFIEAGIGDITIVPLFPQYSSAAWGSAAEKVMAESSKLWNVPSIKFVPPFYDHPSFIEAFRSLCQPVLKKKKWDHVLISFHGLPERHCRKSGGEYCFSETNCCEKPRGENKNCYRMHCFQTAKALAKVLELKKNEWSICFQSRLGRTPWIKPYTDHVISEQAKAGKKSLIVISPSFVADCLETTEEISIRALQQFRSEGGENLTLVPSLNSEDAWVRALGEIIETT